MGFPSAPLDRISMSIETILGTAPHAGFEFLGLRATLLHPVATISGPHGSVKHDLRFAYGEFKNDSDSGTISVNRICESIFHKRHSLFKKALFDSRKNGCTTLETALCQ
jgi:hypothetical protein